MCHAPLRGRKGSQSRHSDEKEEKSLLFVRELSRHWGSCPGVAGEARGQMESSRLFLPQPTQLPGLQV